MLEETKNRYGNILKDVTFLAPAHTLKLISR